MRHGGAELRKIREELGITLREVESSSLRIAEKQNNLGYAISLSRLSEIESKGVLPNIYRIYTLATVYRRSVKEILGLYGICEDAPMDDMLLPERSKTHLVSPAATDEIQEKTVSLRKMTRELGQPPKFNSQTGRFLHE
jgi:transcriptional regulator with XRE-family HTH domain